MNWRKMLRMCMNETIISLYHFDACFNGEYLDLEHFIKNFSYILYKIRYFWNSAMMQWSWKCQNIITNRWTLKMIRRLKQLQTCWPFLQKGGPVVSISSTCEIHSKLCKSSHHMTLSFQRDKNYGVSTTVFM